jgi:hypothetical protein
MHGGINKMRMEYTPKDEEERKKGANTGLVVLAAGLGALLVGSVVCNETKEADAAIQVPVEKQIVYQTTQAPEMDYKGLSINGKPVNDYLNNQ